MGQVLQTKHELRALHATRRQARGESDQERLALGFRDQLLGVPEVSAARRVAAFVSQPGEPGTGPLLETLHAHGVDVLLPFLRADFDLDWGVYRPGELQVGRFGLLVPSTPLEGVGS
ncbi:MAG TPA: 5-formyltetrahydrofolate cyclo-ligase, partial [Nocardioidaceae bacterium]